MNEVISYGICIIILMISIKDSVKKSLRERTVKFALERVFYYFSIFITFLILYFKVDVVLIAITNFVNKYFKLADITMDIAKIAVLMAVFFIIQILIYFILKCTISPIFAKRFDKERGSIIFFSSIIGAVKGSIILSIIFLCIITYNNTLGYRANITLFKNINIYNKISNLVEDKRVYLSDELIDNILPTNNVIVYYNGVTIEDGVKSNEEIDNKALELTKNCTNDIEKARILYAWIGSNFQYDFEKAAIALNNEKVDSSGAIGAWKNKSGICFDFSCLYVAMARANNLKVRLITGEAYDGNAYGPHAWNEVYIKEEGKWIPVDTTFYYAGDYFNNDDFYSDHISDGIAGEW